MKKKTQLMVGALVAMILFTVSIANGQSASQRFTATIPFEFNVGEQTLPAGEYEIAIVNPSSDQRVVRIRSTKGTESAIVHTHPVNNEGRNDAKLVFRAYGKRYFLGQAWSGVAGSGLETAKSQTEKRSRTEYTLTKQRLEIVKLVRAR
jgi:hypothetical protein